MAVNFGFLDYWMICERHSNVSQSINQNVKTIMKSMVEKFKEDFGQELTNLYGQITTDYEYLVGGLAYLSEYAKKKQRNAQFVFKKTIKVRIKNFSQLINVLVILVDETDGVNGEISYDKDIPEISIQIKMFELNKNEKLYSKTSIIRRLQINFSHELMHCYQYLSKNNYTKTKEPTLAVEKIPNSFSYIVYYLNKSEMESVLMSAFTQYKRLKRKEVGFIKCLLRIIDFGISPIENDLKPDNLNPEYLDKKYRKANDLDDLFLLRYFLGVAVPKSRFYVLCSNDKEYRKYIESLDIKDLEKRKEIIDKTYNLLEEKFLDKNYTHIPQAFYLVGNKESLNKLCTNTKYTQLVYDKIYEENFFESDGIYDEEEDTIIHGREELEN